MIKTRATVDLVREVKPGDRGLNQYSVECWGEEPYDYTRRYLIDAKTDTMAAQEGIARFVDEMSNISLKE